MSKNNYFKERVKKFSIQNKTENAPFPKDAYVELTNACNHACVFCANPKMKRSIKSLDLKKFTKFINKAAGEGLEEVGLYSTGEPFMTKNIHNYILESKRAGIKRVYITSNGALATLDKVKKCIENGLDSIKFSINAGSKKTYKLIHGHDDFEKVINNLDDIYNFIIKNDLKTQLLCSFVFTKVTKKEIEPFKLKYRKYFHEDILFLPAMNQGGRTSVRLPELVNNSELPKKVKNYSSKPCEMIWNRLHFTAEGHLTACCSDYENDLVYDKYDDNKKISDQFNNSTIKALRKKHLENDLDNTICKNCIYNTNEDFSKLTTIENEEKKLNKIKVKDFDQRNRVIKNFNNNF